MNNYFNRYLKLIEHYQCVLVDGYYEKHHIIPRCMGGNDENSNLIELPAKAHYIAHLLLYKAFPNNRKLAHAFGMMIKSNGFQDRKFTSRQYKILREVISKAQTGRKRPDLSERNRKNRGKKRVEKRKTWRDYYNYEKLSPEEISKKRSKAGRARKGVIMSEQGKNNIKAAALERCKNAPQITCSVCGHQQKRSPNFYRYHEKNCTP